MALEREDEWLQQRMEIDDDMLYDDDEGEFDFSEPSTIEKTEAQVSQPIAQDEVATIPQAIAFKSRHPQNGEERIGVSAGTDLRLDAIHMHGVGRLTTTDVQAYFADIGPVEVEWINTSSCNAVFISESIAQDALIQLGKLEVGGPKDCPAPWYKGRKARKEGDLVPISLRFASVHDIIPLKNGSLKKSLGDSAIFGAVIDSAENVGIGRQRNAALSYDELYEGNVEEKKEPRLSSMSTTSDLRDVLNSKKRGAAAVKHAEKSEDLQHSLRVHREVRMKYAVEQVGADTGTLSSKVLKGRGRRTYNSDDWKDYLEEKE